MKQEWSGEGLPPVGLRIEYTPIKQDAKAAIVPGQWYRGKIIAYHDGYVWTSDNGIRQIANTEFRPIRTDRDRWIEAAIKALKPTMGRFSEEKRGIAEMIYDAGLAKLPDPPK